MAFIVVHELEYHPYDISDVEELPSIQITSRLSANAGDLQQFNQSGHGDTEIRNKSEDAVSIRNDDRINETITSTATALVSDVRHTASQWIPYRNYEHKMAAFRRYLSGNGKIVVIHVCPRNETVNEADL